MIANASEHSTEDLRAAETSDVVGLDDGITSFDHRQFTGKGPARPVTVSQDLLYETASEHYQRFLAWREKVQNRFWFLLTVTLVAAYTLTRNGSPDLANAITCALTPIGICSLLLDYRCFRMSRLAAAECRELEGTHGLFHRYAEGLSRYSPFSLVYWVLYPVVAGVPSLAYLGGWYLVVQ